MVMKKYDHGWSGNFDYICVVWEVGFTLNVFDMYDFLVYIFSNNVIINFLWLRTLIIV